MVDPRSYGLQIEKFIELWTNKKRIGDSVLVQSKGTETIYFKSIRIIIECSTIYTSSRKQTTKINELLPLHNVQYGKNTASGCTIRKNNVRSQILNGCFWLDSNYSCIIMNYIGRWTICNNQSIHRECIRRVETYWRILSVDSYDPHKQFVARQSYRPYLCSDQQHQYMWPS